MKVLVSTDGEPHSQHVERLLIRLADREVADITAFAVTTYEIDPNDPDKSSLERARDRTRRVAAAAAERLTDQGFRAVVETSEGDPGAEIVRKIEREHFDLAALGAGRHSWLRMRLLGTTSSYVLHNALGSVLIVHECAESGDPLKVLVATDGSQGAEGAARCVAHLADATRCRISVVSIGQPPAAAPQENVEKMIALLEEEGIGATGESHEGSPAGKILQLAEEGNYDLVVLGSLGAGPVRKALLGTVSDHVAHHARASLVTRRSP